MAPTPTSLNYTGLPLQHGGESLKDPAWVEAQLKAENARYLLLHNNRNLLTTDDLSAEALLLDRDQCAPWRLAGPTSPLFLGLTHGDDAHPLLALDVSGLDASAVEQATGGYFIDLRKVGAHIDPAQGSLLGYARGLVYWHAQSTYCPKCGHPTRLNRGGHSRRCTNESCGREHFPRNDPAVIMLVEYRPEHGPAQCLLGRNRRFANRMFSTLAGFVDVGESLEEAVRREVFEEAGIHTFDERYVASQPWPFPGSLMLGFRARARNTDIRIDEDEIVEAGWYTAEQLADFGEWGDDGDGPCLPRRDSIARYLVDLWISEN